MPMPYLPAIGVAVVAGLAATGLAAGLAATGLAADLGANLAAGLAAGLDAGFLDLIKTIMHYNNFTIT